MPDDEEGKRLLKLSQEADAKEEARYNELRIKRLQGKAAPAEKPAVTMESVEKAAKKKTADYPDADVTGHEDRPGVSMPSRSLLVKARGAEEKEAALPVEDRWQKRMDESILAPKTPGLDKSGEQLDTEAFSVGPLYDWNPDRAVANPSDRWRYDLTGGEGEFYYGGLADTRSDSDKDLSKLPMQRMLRDKIKARELITVEEYKEWAEEWDAATKESLARLKIRWKYSPELWAAHEKNRRLTRHRMFSEGEHKAELERINKIIRARQKWAELNMPAPGSEEYYLGPKNKGDNEVMEKAKPRLPGKWRVKPK